VEEQKEQQQEAYIREAILDIETTHLSADLGRILVACLKPVGQEAIVFRLDNYPEFQSEPWSDRPLVRDLLEHLARTVRIITWYGKRFDIPFIRTRKAILGVDSIESLIRLQHLDLYYVARQQLRMHTHRLENYMMHWSQYEKTEVRPQEWQKAAFGHRASMDYVVEHCLRDVHGLEDVYLELERVKLKFNWRDEVV
jgi:uncharacterized protein YprB with RNaseH-like and TPR domain